MALWSCNWTYVFLLFLTHVTLPKFPHFRMSKHSGSSLQSQTLRVDLCLSLWCDEPCLPYPRWVITALWTYSFMHWRGECQMSWCFKWTVNNRNACSRTLCRANKQQVTVASHCWWRYLGANYQNSKAGKCAQDDVGQHCRSPAKQDRMSKFMWMKIILIRPPFHFKLGDSYIHDKHECSTVAWWSLKVQFESYWHLAVII